MFDTQLARQKLRRHPMTAMVPRPRCHHTQQSANMMRDKSILLKLEDNIIVYYLSPMQRHTTLMTDALCLFLQVAAAASGRFWPAKSCSNPSLYR